jgi:pumilio family protein 6
MSEQNKQMKRKLSSSMKKESNGDHKKSKSHSSKDKSSKDKSSNGDEKKPWKKSNKFQKEKPKVLTKQDRKELRKERRDAKPNADIIAHANKLWKISIADLDKPAREAAIEEILTQVQGKLKEVCVKHDASRALQCVVKYGSDQHRLTIFEQLKGFYVELSTHHYGHYLLIKLLQYGKPEFKSAVHSEFIGHVNKLAFQADGAKVLDYLYASADKKIQTQILQEFYHMEYALFGEQSNISLAQLMEQPAKKTVILENLKKIVNKCIEKNMLMFRFVHALIVVYLSYCNDHDTRELCSSLSSYVPTLHHSTDGCRILMHCLSYGTAKDRKHMIKSFKGLVMNMAERVDGHQLICRALDVVDDTVLLDKFIISELIVGLDGLIDHTNGGKIILHVLSPRNANYFSPKELKDLDQTLQVK